MKKLMGIFSALVCCAVLFAASFKNGDTVYVAEKTTKLKASSGLLAKTVKTLSYGDSLIVVKTSGKKTLVRLGSNESVAGWVSNADLTTKKILRNADGSTVTASVEELALAAKGNVTATVENLEAESEKAVEEAKNAVDGAVSDVKEAVSNAPVYDPK